MARRTGRTFARTDLPSRTPGGGLDRHRTRARANLAARTPGGGATEGRGADHDTWPDLPAQPEPRARQRLQVSLPGTLKRQLRKRCATLGLSYSEAVAKAVEAWLVSTG